MNDKKSKKDIVLEGKIWAVIGYLWILCFIPLILKKDNDFSLFHAKQGLVLFIASVICAGISVVPLIGIIGVLGNAAVFVLSIAGIFSSLKGEYWKMPYIGDYAEKIEL